MAAVYEEEAVDIADHFDAETCEKIHAGYARFNKRLIVDVLNEEVFALSQAFTPSRLYSLFNYQDRPEGYLNPTLLAHFTPISFQRMPTPAEYVVLVEGLSHQAEFFKSQLEVKGALAACGC